MISGQFQRFQIDKKLKSLRSAADIAVADLSKLSGVDQETIDACERGERVPSLDEFVLLADALQVGMDYFFRVPIPDDHVEVVRSADRWVVKPQTAVAKTLHFRYQALSYQLTERLLSPFLVEIPPNRSAGVEPSAHAGEEFIFVLSGELEAEVGDETHRLAPGDSLYFNSSNKHSMRAAGTQVVRFLDCMANVQRTDEDDPLDRAIHMFD